MELTRQLLGEAAKLVIRNGVATPALLQNNLILGQEDACRLLNRLEALRIVGPDLGLGDRCVLCTNEAFVEWYFGLPREQDLLRQAAEVILKFKMATISLLLSCLNLNYFQAQYLMDELERMGILGPYVRNGIREVRPLLAAVPEAALQAA